MNIDLTSILGLDRININLAIQEGLEDSEREIIALNDEQLDAGIRSDNQSLGQYKNFKYKGRFTPIDLKLKGDFRKAENLYIVRGDDQFELTDTDYKTPFLTKRYGKEILGLTDENIGRTAVLVTDNVVEKLKNQLA